MDNGYIISFDIGGTWFRSAIVTKDYELIAIKKTPAVNYKDYPQLSIDELQQAMVDYLLAEVERLQAEYPDYGLTTVGISMGAAVNGNNGVIVNCGPIWGPNSKPLDLPQTLKLRAPEVNWHVYNDITAAVAWYASSYAATSRRVALITISTGIGSRTYDLEHNSVPIDKNHGLQGEIGHIAIDFYIKDQLINEKCDCGGENHLNAFCSGRGIEKNLPHFAKILNDEFKQSTIYQEIGDNHAKLTFDHLISSLKNDEPFAKSVLHYITIPLAKMIIHQLTFDPLVEKIILVGGVLYSLNPHYYQALINNLNHYGLYQISYNDPSYFNNCLVIGDDKVEAGLLGAAKLRTFCSTLAGSFCSRGY